jgi:sugar O-acyltransferase (sialic acid O-acetyltransferase NeuD family)
MPGTRKKLIILGAGVFAEEVADLASDTGAFELVGFVEGRERSRCSECMLGLPILWIDDLHAFDAHHEVVCAIGSTKRSNLIRQARSLGFQFPRVIHPSAQISSSVVIGEGSIIGRGAIISASTRIGSHVIVNRGCLIGHHVAIGDYATISPGANIAGKVTIGDHAFVGMGVNIVDGVVIGKSSMVGAGSLVTNDVPEHVQVMGAPARFLRHIDAF